MTPFKNRPLEERQKLVKAIVSRIAAAYGVKKTALPAKFECSAGLINNWGYHGRIPHDYIEKCRIETGISTDWLLYGVETVKPIMNADMDELSEAQAKVLEDGVRYGMITECYDGAIQQLNKTFQSDIETWVKKVGAKQASSDNGN